MKTFAGRLPASAAPVLSSQDSEEPTGPHIAICVHPNEADYVSLKYESIILLVSHKITSLHTDFSISVQ